MSTVEILDNAETAMVRVALGELNRLRALEAELAVLKEHLKGIKPEAVKAVQETITYLDEGIDDAVGLPQTQVLAGKLNKLSRRGGRE